MTACHDGAMDDEKDYRPGWRVKDIPVWIALFLLITAGAIFMERSGVSIDHPAIDPAPTSAAPK
jgi:hypothetical protein